MFPVPKFFRGFPFKPELLLLLSTSLKWLQKSDISFLIYACQRLIYMVIINGVSTPVEFQLTPLLPLVKVICSNYLSQWWVEFEFHLTWLDLRLFTTQFSTKVLLDTWILREWEYKTVLEGFGYFLLIHKIKKRLN